MRKFIIAVCGDASLNLKSNKYKLAFNLGKALIENGYRIINGGLGGIMEAVSKGAKSSNLYSNGDIIGILPNFNPDFANKYIDIVIPSGLEVTRNIIMSNSDALIAIGGGAGTLTEIGYAWQLKRLIIAYMVDGWSGKLANKRVDERIRYPEINDDKVYGVKNEEEVINLLKNLLSKYNKRHKGFEAFLNKRV